MPRTPATITQADVARTVRAAKQAGAAEVEVRPDGTRIIRLVEPPRPDPVADDPKIEWPREVVL